MTLEEIERETRLTELYLVVRESVARANANPDGDVIMTQFESSEYYDLMTALQRLCKSHHLWVSIQALLTSAHQSFRYKLLKTLNQTETEFSSAMKANRFLR